MAGKRGKGRGAVGAPDTRHSWSSHRLNESVPQTKSCSRQTYERGLVLINTDVSPLSSTLPRFRRAACTSDRSCRLPQAPSSNLGPSNPRRQPRPPPRPLPTTFDHTPSRALPRHADHEQSAPKLANSLKASPAPPSMEQPAPVEGAQPAEQTPAKPQKAPRQKRTYRACQPCRAVRFILPLRSRVGSSPRHRSLVPPPPPPSFAEPVVCLGSLSASSSAI